MVWIVFFFFSLFQIIHLNLGFKYRKKNLLTNFIKRKEKRNHWWNSEKFGVPSFHHSTMGGLKPTQETGRMWWRLTKPQKKKVVEEMEENVEKWLDKIVGDE